MTLDTQYSGEIRRTNSRVTGGDPSKRHNHVAMQGKISLVKLREYLDEHAPNTPDDQIFLNWMTIDWEDDATAEDIRLAEERKRDQAARTEAWERKTLAALLNKYGADV